MSINNYIRRYLFREYRLWVVNTTAEAQLYLWENYKLLFPHIDALVGISPVKAFIRSLQSMEGKSGFLGFGRMAWSKENNEKWTKKYRGNRNDHANITFFKTQIWAPDWNHHCKTGVPPDIFLEVYNYKNDHKIGEGLIVTIPDIIYRKKTEFIDTTIHKIMKAIPKSKLSVVIRTWNPGGGFPNQIQDINSWEISKVVSNA